MHVPDVQIETESGCLYPQDNNIYPAPGSNTVTGRGNLVNLDAMIVRADFALEDGDERAVDNVSNISLRDFQQGALLGPNLRKPDFQRETNHWSPEQVASLLECYVNGDLIPSVILWKSPQYLFVIDGGHRLSVLRAWVEDDYGDGPLSQRFFEYAVSREQASVAAKTRLLINARIGSWQHLQARLAQHDLVGEERRRVTAISSRALPIQWVTGNADKAEASFFKINTEGTPLDDIEELLLRNRRRPIAIAARAVIRAGKGHRYWSSFSLENAARIEESAKELHQVLFEPELHRPVKTLDLPLGGAKGIRTALQVLIDFMLIANRNQEGAPRDVESQEEDTDGSATVESLRRSLRLAKRITGNDSGSLGLHPAVYFYGPSGVHSGPMFMGTIAHVGQRLSNNDPRFFPKFTEVRARLEAELIRHKDLIATILQKHSSRRRTESYESLLGDLIQLLSDGGTPTEEWLIERSGFRGRLLTARARQQASRFSDETRSEVFINVALASAPKCPVCLGYLDTEKSVSYDHIERVREGGLGEPDNCQLTHPYCNQSVRA